MANCPGIIAGATGCFLLALRAFAAAAALRRMRNRLRCFFRLGNWCGRLFRFLRSCLLRRGLSRAVAATGPAW